MPNELLLSEKSANSLQFSQGLESSFNIIPLSLVGLHDFILF